MRQAIGNGIAQHVNGCAHRAGVIAEILPQLLFLLLRVLWMIDDGVSQLPALEFLMIEEKQGLPGTLWIP